MKIILSGACGAIGRAISNLAEDNQGLYTMADVLNT